MTSDAARAQPDRLVAVTFVDSGVQTGSLRVELGERATLLVGRNAAGKSLILETLLDTAHFARTKVLRSPLVAHTSAFELELDGRMVRYTCDWQTMPDPDEDPPIASQESLVVDDQLVWSFDATGAAEGRARQDDAAVDRADTLTRVRRVLAGIRLIRAGIPRSTAVREPIYLYRYNPRVEPWRARHLERLSGTLVQLVRWHEAQPELFSAVLEIGQRLHVFETLAVRADALPHQTEDNALLPTHEVELLVDGLNAGYLSDGTLRILEIITNLVNPRTTVLLVEEPETAIHPGLLTRLLAEFDAFAHERQLLVSTHSPALLNWARADEVRLVSRVRGATTARRLTPDEVRSVEHYLADDHGISDYIFSGAID